MSEDFELTLFDRLEVIRQLNAEEDLEHNSYISFSGGKDSTVLSYLIDLALPNNKIPRVFGNTGIEFQKTVEFVKKCQEKDDRVVMVKPSVNIKQTLEKYGYPFKSKQHSHNLAVYQHSGICRSIERYLGIIESNTLFRCPKNLKYQFTPNFKIKCSDKCCLKMKKEPLHKWQKENNKSIAILGLRQNEGGQRASHKGCVIYDKEKHLTKFKPLNPVSNEFIEWLIDKYNIELNELYYAPYNFKRTGCIGCPFNLYLQEELEILQELMPSERKRCEFIWKPIYDEYRRINYRLKKVETMKLF